MKNTKLAKLYAKLPPLALTQLLVAAAKRGDIAGAAAIAIDLEKHLPERVGTSDDSDSELVSLFPYATNDEMEQLDKACTLIRKMTEVLRARALAKDVKRP